MGNTTYQLLQDFSHQQYHVKNASNSGRWGTQESPAISIAPRTHTSRMFVYQRARWSSPTS